MTCPREAYYALKGYADRREAEERGALETMRLQTYYLINFQLPFIHRYPSPVHMMPFPWEEDPNVPPPELTSEDWDALDKKYGHLSLPESGPKSTT